MQRVLVLFANPLVMPALRQGEEERVIQGAVESARARCSFSIDVRWAVRASDLLEHFHRHRPDVVHFSLHGREDGTLFFEADGGTAHPVSGEALCGLLSVPARPRLVVFNACHSADLARACAELVGHAIGMAGRLHDASARAFVAGFYAAYVGSQQSLRDAFDAGLKAMSVVDGADPEQERVPQLYGTKPENTYFRGQLTAKAVIRRLDEDPGAHDFLVEYLASLPRGPMIAPADIPRNLVLSAATALANPHNVMVWIVYAQRLTLDALPGGFGKPGAVHAVAVTQGDVDGQLGTNHMVGETIALANTKSRTNLAALLLTLPRTATAGPFEAAFRTVLEKCEATS